MTCEEKDLHTLTQSGLEQAYRFHAWRAFSPAEESVSSEEIRQRKKDDVDRIDKIHGAYLERFGSNAFIELVKSLKELKEGEIL